MVCPTDAAIVHALAIGIQDDVESDAGRQERLADLREAIGRVARADLLACVVGESLITGKESRLPSFASSYPSRIVSWVCDVEDAL